MDEEISEVTVDNLRKPWELEDIWKLRREFILAHKDKFDKSRLLCLSQLCVNIEAMGNVYDQELMSQIDALSSDLDTVQEFRQLRKTQRDENKKARQEKKQKEEVSGNQPQFKQNRFQDYARYQPGQQGKPFQRQQGQSFQRQHDQPTHHQQDQPIHHQPGQSFQRQQDQPVHHQQRKPHQQKYYDNSQQRNRLPHFPKPGQYNTRIVFDQQPMTGYGGNNTSQRYEPYGKPQGGQGGGNTPFAQAPYGSRRPDPYLEYNPPLVAELQPMRPPQPTHQRQGVYKQRGGRGGQNNFKRATASSYFQQEHLDSNIPSYSTE